ncbi:MAG: hypothetical protein ACLQFR_13450 [Streptosporangiaceae bacterium]
MTDVPIYHYVPHSRTMEKLSGHVPGPARTSDQLPQANVAERFNAWLAVRVTDGVGTMWCAYAFAALALVSLPSAISSGSAVTLESWISQTFLQLVLLSVIMVGQNVLAAASDRRSEATYKDSDAVLHEAVKIQEHLMAQDKVLEMLARKLDAISS